MNQRTAIETQYLKLLGVTLVFSAACIGTSSAKDKSAFASNEVREIILDQIQHLGSGSLAEVIEWDIALKANTPQTNTTFTNRTGTPSFYIELLPVQKKKLDNVNYHFPSRPSDQQPSTLFVSPFYSFNDKGELLVLLNNPSRAGPSV